MSCGLACEPACSPRPVASAGRPCGHDASALGPRARPHRVAFAMLQDAKNRALRAEAGRRAGPAPSPSQPREGCGPCTRPRIDAGAPSPARPDGAALGLLPPLLVVKSSFRSPSTWLLANSSHGDKAGVSPIIRAEEGSEKKAVTNCQTKSRPVSLAAYA